MFFAALRYRVNGGVDVGIQSEVLVVGLQTQRYRSRNWLPVKPKRAWRSIPFLAIVFSIWAMARRPKDRLVPWRPRRKRADGQTGNQKNFCDGV